ncbi:GTP pyrophosphokinase [Ferrimonas pelagia]|uniref:GTP pyrophosphokinase family protein n=1 Tax=Ferrimonas pelagia TaxID=1177826 RepID=A0ABP9FHH4_9GAMM
MDKQRVQSQQIERSRARAVEFYGRYGETLEQIRALLAIRLSQLALAYTSKHRLPPEAVEVSTRVKSLPSFLAKLERKGWPEFTQPTSVIQDLIGARLVCWFVDDCSGVLAFVSRSHQLRFEAEIEDYIDQPKASGYRAIHLLAHVGYDKVHGEPPHTEICAAEMLCEIQIRSKMQDAWGDITHEFHYKAKDQGVDSMAYEQVLAQIAARLAQEDRTLMQLRDAYQRLLPSPSKP